MIVTRYFEALNLERNPFALTPDLSMFYLMSSHLEAADTVFFAYDNASPMVRIYGEPGMGKTMLLKYLEARFTQEREVQAKYVAYNPIMNHTDFFKSLFGVEAFQFDDLFIKNVLGDVLSRGDYVLLIDEAQDLRQEHFVFLKHLVDDSSSSSYGGRLFVVCAGTMKLKSVFELEELKPIAQRAPYHSVLNGLKRDELSSYIEHRLRQVGYKGGLPFSRWALRLIWKSTKGNPRMVNILAERSLLAAIVRGRREVGRKEVKEALKDIPPEFR